MVFVWSQKCYILIQKFVCYQFFIFSRQVFSSSASFSSNSSPLTVRLGLVSEDLYFDQLRSQFNSLLTEYNSRRYLVPRVKIEGIAVCWSKGERPSIRFNTLNRKLILQNVSAVISLLPSKENQLLTSFLSDLSIPVLGSGSREEQWHSREKVSLNS